MLSLSISACDFQLRFKPSSELRSVHRPRTLGLRSTLLIAVLTMGLAATATANPLMSTGECDFDGDGRDDQAIGVPGESIAGVPDVGVVHVLYGASTGLSSTGNQLWHQDQPNVLGSNDAGDQFGWALACGDFDDDGFDDLAIGVPGESVSGSDDAGTVNVLYGSALGLTASGDQYWNQDIPSVNGDAEFRDRFGAVLTHGDFNGDGYDDLAVGVMAEDVWRDGENVQAAGAINVLYGSNSGLTASGDQFLHQDTSGISGVVEERDLFGAALASADFDGDGFDDLAIGVPTEHLGVLRDAGTINVLYGASGGLTTAGNRVWNQDSQDVLGVAEANDRFGASLVAGDFDGDGFGDLAVGVPGEDLGSIEDAGAVNVLFGGVNGLSGVGDEIWTQDSSGVLGSPESHDRFGLALSGGDYDGDGRDDLAIGVPQDSIGALPEVGGVHVLYGASSGLVSAGNQWWHQDVGAVAGSNQAYDRFGSSLASGDYDGDGYADLMLGVPGERVSNRPEAGAANLLLGSSRGLTTAGNTQWHQDRAGILGGAESFDRLSGKLKSDGIYRIPYANGTQVEVTGDCLTHTPQYRIDMHGEGEGPFTIVAAADGVIAALVDTNAEPTDNNNYIWLRHANGEWTKYSHLATGSASALGLSIGDSVDAGQALGIESDVGQARGDHLHFEVGVPWNVLNPLTSDGFILGENRDPVICGIPGESFLTAKVYTAAGC